MSNKPTTKRIDYERWLNQTPPTSDPRFIAMRCRNKQWGRYLKWRYPEEFDAGYKTFWLTHPNLWEEVYKDVPPEYSIPCPEL